MSHNIPTDHGLTKGFLLTLYTLEEPAGILRHKRRPAWMFKTQRDCDAWNTKYAGKEVNPSASRYYATSIQMLDGRKLHVKVAHIIDCIRKGKWPTESLDHVNRNKLDNSIGNHRPATDSQQQMNQDIREDNTSGVTGVYRTGKYKDKWRALIGVNGETIHLYKGPSFEAAVASRRAGEVKYFGKYRRKG